MRTGRSLALTRRKSAHAASSPIRPGAAARSALRIAAREPVQVVHRQPPPAYGGCVAGPGARRRIRALAHHVLGVRRRSRTGSRRMAGMPDRHPPDGARARPLAGRDALGAVDAFSIAAKLEHVERVTAPSARRTGATARANGSLQASGAARPALAASARWPREARTRSTGASRTRSRARRIRQLGLAARQQMEPVDLGLDRRRRLRAATIAARRCSAPSRRGTRRRRRTTSSGRRTACAVAACSAAAALAVALGAVLGVAIGHAGARDHVVGVSRSRAVGRHGGADWPVAECARAASVTARVRPSGGYRATAARADPPPVGRPASVYRDSAGAADTVLPGTHLAFAQD